MIDEAYVILSVEKDADDATLKKRYRTLVKQFHPDRNLGDKTAAGRFNEVQQAYDEICTYRDQQRKSAVGETTDVSPENIRHFVVNVDLSTNFTGTIWQVDGHHLRIEPGYLTGNIAVWDISPENKVQATIIHLDHPTFSVAGKALSTTMCVSKKDVEAGIAFTVPDHPNPNAPKIRFAVDANENMFHVFPRLGLVDKKGNYGTLSVLLKYSKANNNIQNMKEPDNITETFFEWLLRSIRYLLKLSIQVVILGYICWLLYPWFVVSLKS